MAIIGFYFSLPEITEKLQLATTVDVEMKICFVGGMRFLFLLLLYKVIWVKYRVKKVCNQNELLQSNICPSSQPAGNSLQIGGTVYVQNRVQGT